MDCLFDILAFSPFIPVAIQQINPVINPQAQQQRTCQPRDGVEVTNGEIGQTKCPHRAHAKGHKEQKDHPNTAEKDQQKKYQQTKGQEKQTDEAKALAEKALEEQAERSRELNKQQREEAERVAIQAQIRQLISMNRIDRSKGELAYQFADGNKIQSIYLGIAEIWSKRSFK